MVKLLISIISLSILTTSTLAFFDQFFQQQQQFQQQPPPPPNYNELYSSVPCSQYVCPSLQCVPTPNDCPCPFVQDIKCQLGKLGEGSFVCARNCDAVEKALRLGH